MALTAAQEIQTKNLTCGTWKDAKGKEHVSLTRTGRYNKTIAIPVDIFPQVIEAMWEQYDELVPPTE
jgi:hypothetical protein